jgi:hypothetical protein
MLNGQNCVKSEFGVLWKWKIYQFRRGRGAILDQFVLLLFNNYLMIFSVLVQVETHTRDCYADSAEQQEQHSGNRIDRF